jgi:hypothetical protein
MYLADRVAFHLVAMISSLFHLAPLEGQRVPDPKSIVWNDEGMK